MLRKVFLGAVIALLLVAGRLRAEDAAFDSNGVKIYYTVEGQGEPVILIHGFAATGLLNWGLPGVSGDLARNYKVITIDARGHGKSGKPHDVKSYGLEMVDDIVRLLDHLSIPKAHVVGYSMGGLITHKLAVKYPDRLWTATIGGMGWMREGEEETNTFINELSKSFDEGNGIAPLIKRLTPVGKTPPTPEELKALNAIIMSVNDPKALGAVVRGFNELTVSEKELLANKVPLIVLVGSLDPLKARADRMKEKLPDLEVIEIKDTDHMTAFSNPAFRKSLREFLARHKQGSLGESN